MLVIWTGADAQTIRKVFDPVMKRSPVPHRIVADMSQLPTIEPGDVLLACGGKAHEQLVKAGVFPKNRKIGSLRETETPFRGGSLFVTWDPSITYRDYLRFPELQWDLQLACRRLTTGTTKPHIGKYTWVESLHEVIEEIDKRYEKTGQLVPVACDTETLGLDEYAPGVRIISISFTLDEGEAKMLYFHDGEQPIEPPPWKSEDAMDYWEYLWCQINWMLTSPKIALRGANWKYDSRWITHRWNISCTNFKMDTLLIGTLLNENISNSLKMHAKIHTSMGGYEDGMDKHDMGRLDLVPQEELGDYMGGDTDATMRVSNTFKKELLADKKLADFYIKILHPSSSVFEKMERTGIVVDVPYYNQLGSDIEAEQHRLQVEMRKIIPKKILYKHKDAFDDWEKNVFGKPNVMRDLFFSPQGFDLKPSQFTDKKGDPSTKIDHLLTFGDHPEVQEFVGLLSELNSANKTRSTYVTGFLKHLRTDNRFHPHYMLFRGSYGDSDNDDDPSGTNTGRTSAKDPAVQTIPKHTKWTKRLRRAYTAPPGKTILQLDFSQGELRIAACLANEPVMLNAYANGADLHAITAAKLSGYSMDDFMLLPDDVRDEKRSNGKAGNFGLIYGMGPEGYMTYALTSYGVKMTLQKAVEDREGFFDLYGGLLEWHKKYKKIAKMHGWIRSPLGRIRHLPLIYSKDRDIAAKAERNAVNSPVQSTLSDMMQLAMIHIDREYGESGAVEMFLMTHDSIACYVPIEEATIWAKRLKAVLDNLPLKQMFGWDHQIPFPSDAEVAEPDVKEFKDGVRSLASLKKVKVFA